MPKFRKLTLLEVESLNNKKPKAEIADDPSFDEVKKALDVIERAKNAASLVGMSYAFDKPKEEAYLRFKLLGSQSYGSRAEAYIAARLEFKRLSSSLGRGDLYDPLHDEYSEFKVSISGKGQFNLVQIRDFHDLDYYLFAFISICNSSHEIEEFIFKVPAKEVHEKSKDMGLAHGRSADANQNSNSEKRITILRGDGLWKWLEPYRITIKDMT